MTCLVMDSADWRSYPLVWSAVSGPMCRRCHLEPVRAKFAKLCEGCTGTIADRRRVRQARWNKERPRTPKPCANCGECNPKPYRGTQYCVECTDIVREAAAIRVRAQGLKSKKPCRSCGGVKRKSRGAYCDRCYALRDAPPKCRRCKSRPVRAKHMKLCEPCSLVSLAEQRQRKNERERSYARPNRNPVPTSNAARRMNHRLRQERAGRPLAPVAETPRRERGGHVDFDLFPELPVGPLVAVVRRLLLSETAGLHTSGDWLLITGEDGRTRAPEAFHREGAPSVTAVVCERLGITDKTWREWRDGKRRFAQFDTADRVISRALLNWWDVYSPCRSGCVAFGPVCGSCHGYRLARFAFEGS